MSAPVDLLLSLDDLPRPLGARTGHVLARAWVRAIEAGEEPDAGPADCARRLARGCGWRRERALEVVRAANAELREGRRRVGVGWRLGGAWEDA